MAKALLPPLTKPRVEAVQPTDRDQFLWDKLTGFGVKITPSGSRVYIVQFRAGRGRGAPTKRVTIGRHGDPYTVETARKEAERLLGLKNTGNVAELDKARKRKPRKKPEGPADGTVRAAFDAYKTEYLAGKRSGDEIARGLEKDMLKAWRDRPLASIRKADMIALRKSIADRGAPVMAAQTLKRAKTFLGWCADQGLIETAPGLDLKVSAPRSVRQRWHRPAELRLIWKAALKLGYPYGDATRLVMLTGQRREEASAAEWSEFDLDAGTWLIPGDRAKNEQPHLVHLAPEAVALLRALPRRKDSKGKPSRFAFTCKGDRPPSGWSAARRALNALVEEEQRSEAEAAGRDPAEIAPLPGWVVHDFRRTITHGMAALGVAPHISDKILAHKQVISGVAAVYNVYKYAEERRAALDAWAKRLAAFVEGKPSNVVEMPRQTA